MSAPDKDGVTARAHLTAAWAAMGGTPETRPSDLDPPCDFPYQLQEAWDWFLSLSQARGSNGYGPNPITYLDLQAWATMTGNKPSAREVELIMSLDMAFFEARS